MGLQNNQPISRHDTLTESTKSTGLAQTTEGPTSPRLTVWVVEGGDGFTPVQNGREDEDDAEVIRIISARRADRKERQRYEQSNC